MTLPRPVPTRWAVAVAKAHRRALDRIGAEQPWPPMADVTISLIMAARAGYALDWERLLALPDRELAATVSHIHERIDRRTGRIDDLILPPGVAL